MLKWVRKRRAMSLSKKGVITSSPSTKKYSFDGAKTNGSGPVSIPYPSEPPDDENMNEIAEVSVEVHIMLPDGVTKQTQVTSNMPLMDLLVNIAASNRLNPASYSLSVFNESSGKFQDYKANQRIGNLCVRASDNSLKPVTVQLYPKKSETRKSSGNIKGATPFEMTKRFTVNLPHSQKKVLRIPAATTLEAIQKQLCEERHYDPSRYMFQLPGNPLLQLSLQSTVGELQTNEINYISTVTLDGAKSMPDLSVARSQSMRSEPHHQQPYMPNTGETKRKKGFFSFLKKDNKKGFNIQTPPTDSHTTRKEIPKSPQPRVEEAPVMRRNQEASNRPKTMFIDSTSEPQTRPKSMFTTVSETNIHKASELSKQTTAPSLQTVKENLAPAPKPGKKKRAPPPPSQPKPPQTTVQVEINNVEPPHSSKSTTMPVKAEPRVTEAISVNTNTQLAQKIHSRNSSDSSGYHELTLSGAESPDTAKIEENFERQYKPQMDTASIDSGERLNGDSGIRDMSPARRKRPSLAAMETGTSATLPLEKGKPKEARSRSLDRPGGTKKKKAPPPPGPPPKVPGKSPSDTSTTPSNRKAIPEFSSTSPAATSSPRPKPGRKEEMLGIDIVLNNLDDHLDEGLSPEGTVMQMVDNADITVEEVEVDKPRSVRPCSFIAPPPPDEPPPEDSEPVCYDDIIGTRVDTVDRGTETSDDSASYEPGSLKSSPKSESGKTKKASIHSRAESRTSMSSVNTIEDINMGFELAIAAGQETMEDIASDNEQQEDQGYKSEMAQFVERMSKEIKEKENRENVAHDSKHAEQDIPSTSVEPLVLDSLPTSSVESSPRDNQDVPPGDQEVSEITYNFTLESVPPQFLEEGKDAEEEFSETITENIYPFTSSTPAALDKVVPSQVDKEEVNKGSSTESKTEISEKSEKVKTTQEKPKKEKESFVLTLDDLQNVDFSGPKRKKPELRDKPLNIKRSDSTPKRESVTSPVLVLDELKSKFKSVSDDEHVLVTPLRATGNMNKVKDRCSELSFTPNSEGEAEHMLEEKSISMMNLPMMRASAKKLSNDFEKPESVEREIVIVNSERKESDSVNDSKEPPVEEVLNSSDLQDPIATQHEQMQQQFQMWQQQLEQNQRLLANQNLSMDDSSVNLQQQLQAQILIQQQMMAQMQQSMEALKLQSQRKSLTENEAVSVSKKDEPDGIIIADSVQDVKSSVPVPPPAPIMNGQVPKDKAETSISNKPTKQKSKPSRKFEPKLDPREELMIAIRNFGGRAALHKVTVNQTNWGPSKAS